MWKLDGQRHCFPAQTQVTLKLSGVAKPNIIYQYLTAVMIKCDAFTQEPGVSVSQRSARRPRQTEDS